MLLAHDWADAEAARCTRTASPPPSRGEGQGGGGGEIGHMSCAREETLEGRERQTSPRPPTAPPWP
jgi:hypothetical protein